MVDGALHSVVVHDVLAIYVYVRGCLLCICVWPVMVLVIFWLANVGCGAMCRNVRMWVIIITHTQTGACLENVLPAYRARTIAKKNNAQKLFFFIYTH